jgi:hypothetical protein
VVSRQPIATLLNENQALIKELQAAGSGGGFWTVYGGPSGGVGGAGGSGTNVMRRSGNAGQVPTSGNSYVAAGGLPLPDQFLWNQF